MTQKHTPEEFRPTLENYTCQCGAELVTAMSEGTIQVKCGADKSHIGLIEKTGVVEDYRKNLALPITHVNTIERYAPPVSSAQTMAAIWASKQPGLSPAACRIAGMYSMQVGLDPRFGEIACLEFRSGDNKLPTMMITTKGQRTLVFRHAKDVVDRAPVLIDLVTPDDKLKWAGPGKQNDYVCVAWGRLKNDPLIDPVTGKDFIRTTIGIYSVAEQQRDSGKPAGKEPQNQARRRAERRWYETYVPQAVELAKESWDKVRDELGTEELQGVIEADFTEVVEVEEGTDTREEQHQERRSEPAARSEPDADELADEYARTHMQRQTTTKPTPPAPTGRQRSAHERFFDEAHRMRLTPEQALAKLGSFKTWDDYVAVGGTLENALKKL